MPGFAFGWVQLISHRNFLPPVLLCENQGMWDHYHKLLIEFLRFLAPHISHRRLTESSKTLYRGTLRILSIILHDFPEFLCGYHLSLINTLPINCIQLKNLILSAFPPEMRLPDPFTPNLKVDLLPEITQPPKILSDYIQILEEYELKTELDAYLRINEPSNFLYTLTAKTFSKSTGTLNIALINTVVFYAGISSPKSVPKQPLQQSSAAIEIYQHFLTELDPECNLKLKRPLLLFGGYREPTSIS